MKWKYYSLLTIVYDYNSPLRIMHEGVNTITRYTEYFIYENNYDKGLLF